jgi:hypothetical protein
MAIKSFKHLDKLVLQLLPRIPIFFIYRFQSQQSLVGVVLDEHSFLGFI